MKKLLIYNEAGWELGQRHGAPMSVKDVEKYSVNKIASTNVQIYQLGLFTGNLAALHRSSILDSYCQDFNPLPKMHMWKLRKNYQHLRELGTDFLEIVINRCKDLGIACFPSYRINDPHHTFKTPKQFRQKTKFTDDFSFPDLRSSFINDHSNWWLDESLADLKPTLAETEDEGCGFNFGLKEVREWKSAIIKEVIDNYDIDGLDLDFTRIRPFFKNDEKENGRSLFLNWIWDVKKYLNEIGEKRNKILPLSVRVEYDYETNYREGLDVEQWIHNGIVDIVQLGVIGDITLDASCKWFVEKARNTDCKICPSVEGFFYWIGGDKGSERVTTVENIRAAATHFYSEGADGIQLFNFCATDEPHLKDVFIDTADPEYIRFKDKHYVFTLWPGSIMCKRQPWDSNFILDPEKNYSDYTIYIEDDFNKAKDLGIEAEGLLKIRIDGINTADDISLLLNKHVLTRKEETEVRFAWDSFCVFTLYYAVRYDYFEKGQNIITLRREKSYDGFNGFIEVQELEVIIHYPDYVYNHNVNLGE